MIIKTGTIVSHSGASEWGSGRVMEVNAAMATIEFSDGKSRKIAASHFTILQPAAASSYVPPLKAEPAVRAKPAARATKTVKKTKKLLAAE
jgi:transcription elongation factor GreA-like protein